MTMTDVRAAALGEFPAPPPCPKWCTTNHEMDDYKTAVSWNRRHKMWGKAIDVADGGLVSVNLLTGENFVGDRWEDRQPVELMLIPQFEDDTDSAKGVLWFVMRDREAVRALLTLARMISPKVLAAVQTAVDLARSPEVTPAGEDQ